ncbi:MAG TPA: HEPN domain-containing protein [Chloroflexota bacterium]|nr:HEPN domain-containing protein [Chloroflexota bacterium]
MPGKQTDDQAVRGWLLKAQSDLRAARVLFAADPPVLDGVVYHCQQSAEKSLKGFLLWHRISLLRTHDLEEL